MAKLKESRTPLVGVSGETLADMTRIPRFIAEHELKTYPHIEPRVQRKRSIAPERRKVVKDEVAEWLKARIVRKNVGATYQRLVDTIFEGQMGRNLEAYVDDMVMKSKTEPEMIKDVEETLLTLKKVNMKLNPKKCSFGMEEGKFLGYMVTSEGIRANPEKAKAVVNMPSPSNLKQMQRLSGKLAALNRFLSKAAEKVLPCLDTLKKCTNKKDFHWTIEAEEAFQEMKKLITELPTLMAPRKEEERMVYLSTANEAFIAVLLVERHGRQAPIHYKEKSKEEQEAPESKTPENLGTETDIWKLYTDGASNEHGSRAGLRIAAKIKVEKMHAFVDSKLVASQVEGSYEAKSEKTKKYKEKALEMIRSFNNFQISHIPREDNKKADALSKLAAVQYKGLTKGVLIEELNERSVDTVEINAIIKKATRT
ncbi:reverse transcriptase domain-containing protein [Tanacetum coccineum]